VNDGLLEPRTVMSKFEPVENTCELLESLILHILSWFNAVVEDPELASSRPVIVLARAQARRVICVVQAPPFNVKENDQ
jgi:hypothetical protein